MNLLDRYILSSLLGPFGFFALVFAGILWLLQSLRLVDTVISSGQSAIVFLEFSALVLPNVMLFVLPLATFAAALFTINRLYTESELVVMLMSGQSPWTILRPLLAFSGLAMLAMFSITLYLYPLSVTKLGDRLGDIRADFANSLIVAGQFRHPSQGVTFYIRDTNTAGEMAGIFLHDERDASQSVTYSANRAVLVGDTETAQIIMFDGIAQRFNRSDETYSTVQFARFAYDVSGFLSQKRDRRRHPREFFAAEALNPSDAMLQKAALGDYLAEAHDKIQLPILTFVLPLIALGAVMIGSFRRGGFAIRIAVAVGLLVVVQALTIVTKSSVQNNPVQWWLAYLPAAVTVIAGTGMIAIAASRQRQKGPK